MPTDKPNRLLIVDGHAYAYRAYHAIRELSSPTGVATNAIYGFIKMLGKLQSQLEPSHVVVLWDGGLSVERTVEHPEYKAQRPPMPESLSQQIDGINDYLSAAGIASRCQEGVEEMIGLRLMLKVRLNKCRSSWRAPTRTLCSLCRPG